MAIETDLIVRAISEGFEKVSKDLQSAGDAAAKSGENAKGSSLKWTELKSQLDLVVGAAKKAAEVINTGFQWGEQGAKIAQTNESFDQLVTRLGAVNNLEQQLNEAAGGTIPTLKLQSSTLTLLAGVTGEFGTELANATPQLLAIAKAANALNPSLGDTAFLYESITTGIKRGSPLILDNLGLTIKIGEANEKYAAQLGKTTEELTGTEQKQALLNATLEAGNVLMEQAAGVNTELVDSYALLRTNAENAANSLKAMAAQSEFGEKAIGGTAKQLGGINIVLEAMDKGVISTSRGWSGLLAILGGSEQELHLANEIIAESEEGLEGQAEALADTTDGWMASVQPTVDAYTAWQEASRVNDELADKLAQTNTRIDAQEGAFRAAVNAAEEYRERLDRLNSEQRELLNNSRKVEDSVFDMLDGLNREQVNPIADFVNDVRFLLAGGAQIIETQAIIKYNLEAGNITGEEAIQASIENAFAAARIDVEIGVANEAEAKAELAEIFNLTPEQVDAYWGEWLNGAEQAKDIADGILADVRPFTLSLDDPDAILDRIEFAAGDHNVNFHITTSGDPIPSTGSGAQGGSAPGQSTGASNQRGNVGNINNSNNAAGMWDWMTVPSGYPNDSYTMGLTSGEQVFVANSPSQKAAAMGGAGMTNIFNITGSASDGRMIADEIAYRLAQQARLQTMSGGARA